MQNRVRQQCLSTDRRAALKYAEPGIQESARQYPYELSLGLPLGRFPEALPWSLPWGLPMHTFLGPDAARLYSGTITIVGWPMVMYGLCAYHTHASEVSTQRHVHGHNKQVVPWT